MMLHLVAEQHVNRPADEVFAFVGRDYFAHQTIWDPAVVEMRPLTAPPIGVGSRANFDRDERRRRITGVAEVVAYEEGRLIAVVNHFDRGDQTRTISCHQLRGGGTRLEVVIDNDVHGIASLIGTVFQGLLERGLKMSLVAVKRAIEDEPGADTPPGSPSA